MGLRVLQCEEVDGGGISVPGGLQGEVDVEVEELTARCLL
jgi:hypothetical protein